MDGKSLLKIWNLNKLGGVIGVFNCQGSGSWSCKERNPSEHVLEPKPSVLSSSVKPVDVEFLQEVAGENWAGNCAVYAFKAGTLSRLTINRSIEVTFGVLHCEIYTISPIRVYNQTIHFAPIGLVDMYNSGGAIEALNCSEDSSTCKLQIIV
ncbi:hypothetical protein GIB67_030368 [Kingdonia uniflora]|uniref:Uncharacterized protein n=1 Tax=Kingdonia uniflora TaxID=39325 RepID=A0A7J7M6R5_9MAGN|nr:hypothetical protein GIB67_030368 [Kingdonia uniflora]